MTVIYLFSIVYDVEKDKKIFMHMCHIAETRTKYAQIFIISYRKIHKQEDVRRNTLHMHTHTHTQVGLVRFNDKDI